MEHGKHRKHISSYSLLYTLKIKNKKINIYIKRIYSGPCSYVFRSPAGGNMAERDIVAAIMRMIRQRPRCFCWKEHGGMYGTAGIPDIIACVNGRFVAFEVKTESGKVSKLQEITIQRIRDAGGQAYVVRSVEKAAGILDELEGACNG